MVSASAHIIKHKNHSSSLWNKIPNECNYVFIKKKQPEKWGKKEKDDYSYYRKLSKKRMMHTTILNAILIKIN